MPPSLEESVDRLATAFGRIADALERQVALTADGLEVARRLAERQMELAERFD